VGFWFGLSACGVGRVQGKPDCTAPEVAPRKPSRKYPAWLSQGRVKASPFKLFPKQQASGGLIAPPPFPYKRDPPLVGSLAHFYSSHRACPHCSFPLTRRSTWTCGTLLMQRPIRHQPAVDHLPSKRRSNMTTLDKVCEIYVCWTHSLSAVPGSSYLSHDPSSQSVSHCPI